MQEPIVTICVGGQEFKTLLSTLKKHEGSLLADSALALQSSVPTTTISPTSHDHKLFFDRDPRYFSSVLNFLRTGKLIHDDGVSLDGIAEEAEYFRIEALMNAVRTRREHGASSVTCDLSREKVIWVAANSDRRSFRGLRLRNLDLTKLDLMGANFCKADLHGAKFDEADMIHARFSDANLENASFRGANLAYTLFHNARLTNADFTGANLHGAQLQGSILRGTQFADAVLHKAKFDGADLEGNTSIAIADIGPIGAPNYKGSVPAPIISVTDHDPGYLTD